MYISEAIKIARRMRATRLKTHAFIVSLDTQFGDKVLNPAYSGTNDIWYAKPDRDIADHLLGKV